MDSSARGICAPLVINNSGLSIRKNVCVHRNSCFFGEKEGKVEAHAQGSHALRFTGIGEK